MKLGTHHADLRTLNALAAPARVVIDSARLLGRICEMNGAGPCWGRSRNAKHDAGDVTSGLTASGTCHDVFEAVNYWLNIARAAFAWIGATAPSCAGPC
jgi:hypothetical protein